jgi:hypothetical protein
MEFNTAARKLTQLSKLNISRPLVNYRHRSGDDIILRNVCFVSLTELGVIRRWL